MSLIRVALHFLRALTFYIRNTIYRTWFARESRASLADLRSSRGESKLAVARAVALFALRPRIE